jgi:hypothetical protein
MGRRLWLWTILAVMGLGVLVSVDVLYDGGMPKDWVKPERSLAFFGFLVGALVVAWQLARQHENALAAQATQTRGALNLEIYKDFASSIEQASHSNHALIASVMAIQLDIHTRRIIFQSSGDISPSGGRGSDREVGNRANDGVRRNAASGALRPRRSHKN